ncbi:MAG: peptidylprolyl isomerase A [Phycisphaerales bacterium]|nr:peptidylprolyl isomerase A [Phycisphaerales bacterium]
MKLAVTAFFAAVLCTSLLAPAQASAASSAAANQTLSQAAPSASPADAPAPALEFARMKTSLGDLVLELDRSKAPLTVDNFVSYIKDGFYSDTTFHRIVPGFVIQGGGFTKDLVQKKTRAGVKNEWQNGLHNLRGTLSMARQGHKPDSGTSQFFINLKDNAQLDKARDGAAYAVFARVVAGMSVVDAIAKVETGPAQSLSDVPKTPVIIESVQLISAEDAKTAIEADAAAAAASAAAATAAASAGSPAKKD